MVHVYSTLIGGLLAGAATAVCRDKGRRQCINDESCGWQKLKTGNGTEKNCVAVKPEANPGTCETETAKLETKVGKQKKQINKLKAKIAKLKKGCGSGSGSGQDPPTAEPEFVVHEGVGWCDGSLKEQMWKGSVSQLGGDKTADNCWTECQAKYDAKEPRHQFYNDGVDTWCYCQDGCPCLQDVGKDNTLAPPDFSPPTSCPEFVVLEGVGWCNSNLNQEMWYGTKKTDPYLADKTADKCWADCQAKYDAMEPRHEFYNDGEETWCYCQDGCPCMQDVGNDNTLAPPDFSPPTICQDSGSGSGQDDNMVYSAITCSEGCYPFDIGWSLACSDGTTLSGGAPYDSSYALVDPLAVARGATCTLEMTDLYADGWEGGEWAAPGFGQTFTMDGSEGQTKTVSFVVQ